ncbi:MAG: hypothetical protein KHX03_10210 [Clostridium sp.]|nr:hypothetical protein [Clostridium sp.]
MNQINTNPTFVHIMPKVKLTPIKQKTQQEELQEIIQAPDDPLAKYPLRAFGYSNEVGAAVSAMPGWGRIAETALWVPALMYLGADIYDKYKRGRDGNYSKESATKGMEQAVFQALASVILPTAAVKMGQGVAGQFAKFDGSNLNATVKEELLAKLEKDFSKAKFTKGDRADRNGVFKTGKEWVWERINDRTFGNQLQDTKEKLKNESVFRKIIKFFGHSSGYDATVKANSDDVTKYLKNKVFEIFEKQTLIETGTLEDIKKTGSKKFVEAFIKAEKNAEKNYHHLIQTRPNFIIEKILSSGELKYENLKNLIDTEYPTIDAKINLVAASDKGREISAKLLKKLMNDSKNKELIENIAKKASMSNEIINKYIQSRKLKMGLLKTTGGFIALGLLAVPIDHFVHKYIIKKFLEPGLENMKNLQSKMSFKQSKKVDKA